jgi:benzodiazapine receptor
MLEYHDVMKSTDIIKLGAAIAVAQLTGIIGSLFTVPAIPSWYAGLAKPAYAPPNWIFAPVWTTLFLLMGIAAFLVWRRGQEKREVKIGLAFFLAQLALNLIWSVIFFGLRNPGGALIEIAVLWSAILATAIAFREVSRTAALLLLPYLAWVTFAAYLNYSIWSLN